MAAVAGLCLMPTPAQAQVNLFDTGPPNPVIFNGNVTFLGFSAGFLSDNSPQRWSAQAFTLPAGLWDITQIDVDYFIPAGSEFDQLNWVVWSRDGANSAPGAADQIAAGSVAAPVGMDDPEVDGVEDWLHQFFPVGLQLAGGDYYLTIYGEDSDPLNHPANAAWLTAAADGINMLDANGDAHMWRSFTQPDPGFEFYQLDPALLTNSKGQDPLDVYNSSFTIYGVPGPGSLALLGVAGLFGRRRRRA
ncbi:MAG: hypothetical protein V3W34_05170 [Phycisphaerae bacterium]